MLISLIYEDVLCIELILGWRNGGIRLHAMMTTICPWLAIIFPCTHINCWASCCNRNLCRRTRRTCALLEDCPVERNVDSALM